MWAEELHLFLRLKVGYCLNFLRLLRCLGENDTNDLFILGWLFFFLRGLPLGCLFWELHVDEIYSMKGYEVIFLRFIYSF